MVLCVLKACSVCVSQSFTESSCKALLDFISNGSWKDLMSAARHVNEDLQLYLDTLTGIAKPNGVNVIGSYGDG